MNRMQAAAHEIAREQIADWRDVLSWEVADCAAAIGLRYSPHSWRDVEGAIAAAWLRLPLWRRFEKVEA